MRLENEEIRAGTPLYVPVYALHRHEAYWPRPDEFDPGRFKREIARARDRYTYLPFGAGASSLHWTDLRVVGGDGYPSPRF